MLLLNGLRALFAALPQRIVHVELTGARSKGEELNVKTTNGGVNIETPNNYSAHLKPASANRDPAREPVEVPAHLLALQHRLV